MAIAKEPADIPAEKKALRAEMIARRSALPAEDRATLSRAAAFVAKEFVGSRPGCTVSAFLSFGDELDTAPVLRELDAAGHPLCLPVMQGKSQPLLFRAYRPGDTLRTVKWGIQEPFDTAPALVPDVLLVPLLAFDRAGYRLGYGGGYYDRTLRDLRGRHSILAVGLAFVQQEVDAVPHLDYDERLDWVLTPSSPIRCHS